MEKKSKLEDLNLTKNEVDKFTKAFKDEEFKKLFFEYIEEISNPENKEAYEQEIYQLEQEKGKNIVFMKPEPAYVLKSINNRIKVFVNICTHKSIEKPTANKENLKGNLWSIPHSFSHQKEDFDKNGEKCIVYDFIVNPETIKYYENNKRFKNMIHEIIKNSMEKNFGLKFENYKFPKLKYKGKVSTLKVRLNNNENKSYREQLNKEDINQIKFDEKKNYFTNKDIQLEKSEDINETNKSELKNFTFLVPKYIIKYQNQVDIQNFVNSPSLTKNTYPDKLYIEIFLDNISSASVIDLDILEKRLKLKTQSPIRYYLDLKLAYLIDESKSSAKFDKLNQKLCLSLTVIKHNNIFLIKNLIKEDDENLNVYSESSSSKMNELSDNDSIINTNSITTLDQPTTSNEKNKDLFRVSSNKAGENTFIGKDHKIENNFTGQDHKIEKNCETNINKIKLNDTITNDDQLFNKNINYKIDENSLSIEDINIKREKISNDNCYSYNIELNESVSNINNSLIDNYYFEKDYNAEKNVSINLINENNENLNEKENLTIPKDCESKLNHSDQHVLNNFGFMKINNNINNLFVDFMEKDEIQFVDDNHKSDPDCKSIDFNKPNTNSDIKHSFENLCLNNSIKNDLNENRSEIKLVDNDLQNNLNVIPITFSDSDLKIETEREDKFKANFVNNNEKTLIKVKKKFIDDLKNNKLSKNYDKFQETTEIQTNSIPHLEVENIEEYNSTNITVIQNNDFLNLHGILKRRTISDCSNDISTNMNLKFGSSLTEDEDELSGSITSLPMTFKKSVSFNQRIDKTLYKSNESVSSFHMIIKNKKRRFRKREKHEEMTKKKKKNNPCLNNDHEDVFDKSTHIEQAVVILNDNGKKDIKSKFKFHKKQCLTQEKQDINNIKHTEVSDFTEKILTNNKNEYTIEDFSLSKNNFNNVDLPCMVTIKQLELKNSEIFSIDSD